MIHKAGDIATLINKHMLDELTDNEKRALTDWINTSAENREVFNELTNENSLQLAIKEFYEFKQGYDQKLATSVVDLYDRKTNWFTFKHIAVAAAIIAVISMIWLYTNNNHNKKVAINDKATKKIPRDIAPGSNKAVLTLADGSTIMLDSSHKGLIATQGKTAINKKQDGEIEYNSGQSTATGNALTFNTISTPRGGQYQLTLPDGSKVWLNAASSLKFPVSFSGKERVVQLTGEAYFEVAHVNMPGSEERMPFEVQVNNGMKIQVLGTTFNVNAYDNEGAIKTTLVQGKVSVHSIINNEQVMLDPGEQAQLIRGSQALNKTKNIDVDAEVAWRFGFFNLNNADLKMVMRQLGRWYDVDVQYAGEVPEREFVGTIPRTMNLSKVLSILQKQNVHFKIEGKIIIVTP